MMARRRARACTSTTFLRPLSADSIVHVHDTGIGILKALGQVGPITTTTYSPLQRRIIPPSLLLLLELIVTAAVS